MNVIEQKQLEDLIRRYEDDIAELKSELNAVKIDRNGLLRENLRRSSEITVLEAEVESLKADYRKVERETAEEFCEWDQWGDDFNTWDTSCGQAQCFIDGNVAENDYKYCQYCGKTIKEKYHLDTP